MTTYLFITKPVEEPHEVKFPDHSFWKGVAPWWSCSSTTKCGDTAFVYVTGSGIEFEWEAVSDARKSEEWKYICDVKFVRPVEPIITIQQLRDVVSKDEWAPPYRLSGFRSLIIPHEIAERIRLLRPVN